MKAKLYLDRHWRRALMASIITTVAAIAGLTFGSQPVAAATRASAGYSCFGTDMCHAGGAQCCDDVSFDHCTTNCTIIIHG